MFNSISGTITAKMPTLLFIEKNGIEWQLFVSTNSLDSFGPVGSQARVFTWLQHRDELMKLYGFFSVAERNLFLDLMKVDGIGPKQALKILSSIPFQELEEALDAEDISRLESAPGIGKKTAQKMILALKGKLTRIDDFSPRSKTPALSQFEDIIQALCGMGFDRRQTSEMVEKIASELKYAPGVSASEGDRIKEQELFRRSIVALSS